jgi:hypothetical protein
LPRFRLRWFTPVAEVSVFSFGFGIRNCSVDLLSLT